MNKKKPRGRGRPHTGNARPHKLQVCYDDAQVAQLFAAVDKVHQIQGAASLQPRELVAPSRLVAVFADIAARRPEIVEAAAAQLTAEVMRRREDRARRDQAA